MRSAVLFILLLLAGAASTVRGQSTAELASAMGRLEWRQLGPTIMGGRISDLAVVESDPSTFYVGTATGGVWKTVNAGVTFEPIFDDYPTASVGDVTVAPSNPRVVWVGSGEPQNRQSSPWGDGVYRSIDAGRTWVNVGLADTHHIARIVVHPTDPDVAWVAAVGHLWGPNEERGVFKTVNGGLSWERVLFIDDQTGAIDLVMDPSDPKTLFAAMYQRQRKAWGFNGGGPGGGIYRSVDGGQSWTELTEGLPEGDKGRIGLDIYRRDGRVVCAVVEADARGPDGGPEEVRNGVYCSTDGGDSWEHRSTTNNRPMYYSQIRIDPNDPQRIYLGGSDLFVSTDGGRTFSDDAAAEVHLDHHALWIDPSDSDHLILGSDGGVSVSWDGSEEWYQFRNLPLGQFYEIGVDMRDPYHVCGGLQDNGSWCAPSDTRSNQGIRTRDWYNVGSGDGFFTVMHPTDPGLMFAESQGGNLTRVDLDTGERARLRPVGRPEADDGEMPELRWNWNTPILLSAHDENTIYTGANVLFRSTDLGQTFEAISGDLTWAIDRDTLGIMGVAGADPQMSRNDGQSSYGNLTAVAESPIDSNVLYTGSDDGRVHVTRDGGGTWTDITGSIEGLPPMTYVTRLVASHTAAGRVYGLFDGHRNDDFAPYVFVSEDFGESWRAITSGLPGTSVNALAEHPDNPMLLFLGNEVGLWASADAGANWVAAEGLPTVPVDDIKIHPRDNDLVLGTHGRGIWILDDITPLQYMTADVLASSAYVFPVRPATSYNLYTPQGWTPGIWEAPNPEPGARLRYFLSEATDDVSLRITDATGNQVRMLDAPGERGLNEVVWDLRLVENDAAGEPMEAGPRVLPGVYIAELASGNDVVQAEVVVRLDPRVEMARRELMVRHESMLESYRLSGPTEQAEEALDTMGDRLDDIESLLDQAGDADPLMAEVEAIRTSIEELGDALDEASDGASAWGRIQGVSGPPTADQLWQIERSWSELPSVIEDVNELAAGAYSALLARVYTDAARPTGPAPVPTPDRRR